MSTLNRNLQILLDKLQNVKQIRTNQWQACCPAHESKGKHSLSITLDYDKILLHCFGDCDTTSILRAIDSNYKDLFAESENDNKTDLIEVTRYPYTDETDKLLYYSVRYIPKTFRPCRVINGKETFTLGDTRRVLYHLHDILRAKLSGHTIFICEGEKDTDNIWLKTIRPATCNIGGAGKWLPEYTESLAGAKEIVICPDNDSPGYNHARLVADSLYNKVGSLKILIIPAPNKDVSDWIETIPKWDNDGRQDYDYEVIPIEFEKLINTAIEYTPQYQFPFPTKQITLSIAGGFCL